ncbi:endonuclease domain-containing protein [Herbiconiux sp. SYSU D00978]|uniref:endonuclease domain-containing protein n=1 Tax=Herbiconiux sp. SYSU D00978 TaxID=2812562 RepID=UPI001F60E7E4|nr:hypothetical protein [Herbiconiux sp. SYSU D00978]
MYSTRDETDAAVAAVALGCRLTGLTALHELGCWMWRPATRHYAIHAHADRPSALPEGVTLHWEQPTQLSGGTVWAVSLESALRRVAIDEPVESAVAALDWALHTGRLPRSRVVALLATLPRPNGLTVAALDARCESFPESIVRTRLRALGHHVTSQQPVSRTRQRIDLVVDGVLAIEVDGREFHESEFERDRRKDVAIVREGRSVLRVSAAMVEHCWPDVEEAVRVLVDRHRGASGALRRRIRRIRSEPDRNSRILLR